MWENSYLEEEVPVEKADLHGGIACMTGIL